MRRLVEPLIAWSLPPMASPPPMSPLACALSVNRACCSTAAYDLKKLKHIVRRMGHTRRYDPLPTGLRAITALLVLRDKAIKPLLAAARLLHAACGRTPKRPLPSHPNCHEGRLP